VHRTAPRLRPTPNQSMAPDSGPLQLGYMGARKCAQSRPLTLFERVWAGGSDTPLGSGSVEMHCYIVTTSFGLLTVLELPILFLFRSNYGRNPIGRWPTIFHFGENSAISSSPGAMSLSVRNS
jgi:hypothetical protein